MGLSKEKKPNKILRGLKTLFFLMNMLVSLLLFSAPVLLVVTDALIPSALLSAFISPLSSDTLYSLLRNYDFQASIVDIPLISIARSLVIICVYSVCDGPKLSHGPYLGVTTLCSLISVAFVSLKACVYGAKINGGKSLMMRFQRPDLDVWATEAMFLCSLILAVGHILVAYRTSCRERRKLLVYRIDLEAIFTMGKDKHKASTASIRAGKKPMAKSLMKPVLQRPTLLPRWHRKPANSNGTHGDDLDPIHSNQSQSSSHAMERDDSEHDIPESEHDIPISDGVEIENENDEVVFNVQGDDENPNPSRAMNTQTGEVPKERKVRRETRCLNIVGRRLIERPTIILNDKNQPIGPKEDVASLSSFLGTMARNTHLLPLTLDSWHEVDMKKKDELWKEVMKKYIIHEDAKKWVFSTISSAMRVWKCRLKAKHFKKHTRTSTCLKDRPKTVPMEQWAKIVKKWSSEESKVLSEANAKNRMNAKYIHTMGSKSFARVREEEKRKRPNEEEPSDVDMFMLTRKRKDGSLNIDEDTRIELEQLSSQPPDTPESSTARDIFLKKVFKDHSGRAPLYGKGVVPSDLKRRSINVASEGMVDSAMVRERRAIEAEERYERMISGLHTVLENIRREYPNIEIPQELFFQQVHGSPGDAGSACVIRQRSSAGTNNVQQVLQEENHQEDNNVQEENNDAERGRIDAATLSGK